MKEKLQIFFKGFLKERNSTIAILIAYVILLQYLFIFDFKDTLLSAFGYKLFVYNFNLLKYFFSCFASVLIIKDIINRLQSNLLTDNCIILLELLYFLPGTVFQAVTNASWQFILFYLGFWAMLVLWDRILPRYKGRLKKMFAMIDTSQGAMFLTISVFIITVYLVFAMRIELTYSRFMLALRDVYGIRAAGKAANHHWLLQTILYYSVYIGVVLIALHVSRKKYALAALLCLCEVILFSVQAERMVLFYMLIAIASGLIFVDKRLLLSALVTIMVLIVYEGIRYTAEGRVASVFQRFSIIPNRLAEQYYDFFSGNEPDYLRTSLPRIAKLIGWISPYKTKSIEYLISVNYYNFVHNPNTGMVGGAMAQFGIWSVFVSSFGYIASFRIFELAAEKIKDSRAYFVLAVTLVVLAINGYSMLANILKGSYFTMLLVSVSLLDTRTEFERAAERGDVA